jgi:threonyl-tRNA synthetase
LSPSGAIERVIYSLLEKEFMKSKKGKNAMLPLWLSPTQVRIASVSDKHVKKAKELMQELEKNNIRVDLDERDESISKKIREAEKEWIPCIIVFGDKEVKEKKFKVRFRESGKIKEMTLNQLIEFVKKETNGKPFRPVPLPKLLSVRPKFSS